MMMIAIVTITKLIIITAAVAVAVTRTRLLNYKITCHKNIDQANKSICIKRKHTNPNIKGSY